MPAADLHSGRPMTSLATSLIRGTGALAHGAVLRLLAKTVAVTLVIFAAVGLVAWKVLEGVITRYTANTSYALDYQAMASVIALFGTVLAGWLLFRVIALAVLHFFADEVVIAVERRAYPQAAETARQLPLSEDLRNALAGAGRAVLANLVAAPVALALLFTGVGTALVFWTVNAWLLGRELTDMVWLRHRPTRDSPPPIGGGERFLLGGAIAALFMVPFVNVIAPVLGAAAATHLVHGRLRGSYAA